MLKTILVAALTVSISATAAFSETQVVKQLKACGSEAKNSFGTHAEHPADDEGAGYVSFATEDVDATGTKERFTLVNCATRKLVQLNAEYLLTDSSKGLPGNGDPHNLSASVLNEVHLARWGGLMIEGGFLGLNYAVGYLHLGLSTFCTWDWGMVQLGASRSVSLDDAEDWLVHPEVQFQLYF